MDSSSPSDRGQALWNREFFELPIGLLCSLKMLVIGVAKEGYKGHGFFTYVLLDALAFGDENSDGKLQVGELGRYLESNVPRLSEKLRSVRQQPQVRIMGAEFAISNRVDVSILDHVRAP
jgi:hypothetical protein